MRVGRFAIFALALTAWGCAGGDSELEGVVVPDGSLDTSGGGDDTSITPTEDSSFNLDGSACKPKTCVELNADCGPVADGCGGLLDCGPTMCPKPGEICGGGGPSKCGVADTGCVPKTCTELDANCGMQGDGCGNLINCGTCSGTDTCGGAGVPNKCGTPPKPPCTAKTCAEMGYNCGPVADGCGGLVNCGTCTTGTCGGGGSPNKCGSSTSPCIKKSCADWGANCGQMSDGCGGLTPSCGTCSGGNICGGGTLPNVCGGAPPPCTAKTCADYPTGTCGPMPNGCGGMTADCGTCPMGQTCGGGGPSKCGGPPPCVAKTCADFPTGTCGQVSDGCGGLTANCGTCTMPDICGGGGVPSKCGGGSSGTTSCVNLECKQITCTGTATSSISGKVYDPAGLNPLYNVFVYIPNGTPGAFTAGATCDKCADALSGFPLVQTVTDEAGNFRLTNVPVGVDIPLVIQTGKWRRQVKITTRACIDTPIDASLTRFPRNKTEGDIPQFAITTGSQDNLECLLRNIGIADSEFTAPTSTGRVHMYTGFCDNVTTGVITGTYSCPPTLCPSGTVCETTGPYKNKCVQKVKMCGATQISRPGYTATLPTAKSALWNSVSNLSRYDAVLMDCEGGYGGEMGAEKSPFYRNMFDYAGLGGRVFGSHYHLQWVKDGPTPWPSLAAWNLATDLKSPTIGTVITTFPKGSALARWLVNVGASAAPGGFLSIDQAQHSIDTVDSTRTTNWITAYGQKDVSKPALTVPSAVQYMSFNTPVGSTSQCGRVVLSDIHVDSTKSPSNDSSSTPFPLRCGSVSALTPQQKALEFMIFDLASRVCDDKLPPPPPSCTKRTCAEQGIDCGSAPDGCGGTLTCGTCPSGQFCGTGGKCAGTACTPTSCMALGVDCGTWANGCGGTLSCGTCTTGTCGGGGVPGKCGGASCIPKKCSDYGYDCGSWADGCGGVLNCGTCTPPATCGGTGIPGKCGGTGCVKKTCAELGVTCGLSGDGCGGTQDCGACDGGVPMCRPLTCGGRCGPQGDGCGGVLTCPACPGGTCVPTNCDAAGAECGQYPDGCGRLLECGACAAPKTCGGGGPNKCGTIG